uniref:G-protein coupled receptors family 1 profile domain-containing protein n=1 Tax=Leptobrachium leishanense TaxID=445787 RepID=A0A8C5QSI9_9ANUR
METEAMTLSSVTIKSIYFTNSTKVEKPLQSVIISPISMVVAVIGVVGNGFVIWFLSFKIKKNPSTIYIFNLAVADAFFLLCISVLNGFSLGLNITSPMENKFEDDHLNNVVCALSLSCLFGYNTSLCLLTVISVERCICVLFPIWYHCNRPRYLSSIMCTVIWLNSCLFTVFEFVFCFNLSFRVKYLREISEKECKYTFMIICCLGFIVFVPSMIVSSIVLLIKICTNSQHRQHRKLYLVITVPLWCCTRIHGWPWCWCTTGPQTRLHCRIIVPVPR